MILLNNHDYNLVMACKGVLVEDDNKELDFTEYSYMNIFKDYPVLASFYERQYRIDLKSHTINDEFLLNLFIIKMSDIIVDEFEDNVNYKNIVICSSNETQVYNMSFNLIFFQNLKDYIAHQINNEDFEKDLK